MKARRAPGWQLILADLALILFVVTLSALVAEAARGEADLAVLGQPVIAPSQALYRESADGPSLKAWLSDRPNDPRATLTILGQHSRDDREDIWESANSLASEAAQSGFAVRVVITQGSTSGVYASLAYDTPRAEPVTAPDS